MANENIAKRFAKKAQNLLSRRGGKLRFIGGTALDQTSLTGMESILKSVNTLKDREFLAEAVSQCLEHSHHDWTVIYGFIVDDTVVSKLAGNVNVVEKYGVEVDSLDIKQATSNEMAMAANYAMANEFRDIPVLTRLGQVWMAIPKTLPDHADEVGYINELVHWMGEVNFFNAKHMHQRLDVISNETVT